MKSNTLRTRIINYNKLVCESTMYFKCCPVFGRPSTCTLGSLRWLATEKKLSVKLAERPRKPPPPLFLYQMSVRKQLEKENPDKKLLEITKLASAQYKELSDEKKEELRLQYEESIAEYKKAVADFHAGCTQEEIDEMLEEKRKRRETRKKRKLKVEMKEMKKPKKPPSSFLRFMMDRRQTDINNDPEKMKIMNVAEYSKEVVAVWKKMSDSEKQPYIDKFHKENEDYQREMEVWEAKMVKQNKKHLVRVGHQDEPEKPKKQKKRKRKVTSIKTASGKRTAKKKTRTRTAVKKKSATTKKKATTEKEHELSDSDSEE